VAHWPRALTLAAFLSLQALAQTPAPKSALDKATMEAYLRHLNVWGPQVTLQIDDPTPSPLLDGFFDVHIKATMGPRSGEITYLVSGDGRKIVQANVFDINWNPFREDLAKLKTDGAPGFGTPGATVVIVMFSDFECSYCKQQAEVLRKNLLKDYPKQVRVYFKDYPLQAIHPWAKDAAIAARCIYREKTENFWDVHDFYFEKQSEITPENLKRRPWNSPNPRDGTLPASPPASTVRRPQGQSKRAPRKASRWASIPRRRCSSTGAESLR